MKIGELASATATPIETIRFYEREGLLPEPQRTPANYRIYGAEHVERLAFIRHCRGLDMALHEIRVLLRFKDAPHQRCDEVNALLDEHIGHVASRIRELKALERELKSLRGQCATARDAKDCGILEGLSRTARQMPAASTPAQRHVNGSHGQKSRSVDRPDAVSR